MKDEIKRPMFEANAQAVMNERARQRRSLQTSRPGRSSKSGYTIHDSQLGFCSLGVASSTVPALSSYKNQP